MDNILGIVSIVLLVVGISFFVYQLMKQKKLQKNLGDRVLDVFPSQLRKRAIIIVGIAFVLVVIVAIILYALSDTSSNYINVFVLGLVLLAAGRYVSRFVTMYQKGILAHMHVIKYHEIKSYDFRALKSKKLVLTLTLQRDTKFATIITEKEKPAVEKALKKAI